jgi:archaellin
MIMKRFNFNTIKRNKKAIMGIGTLIIFISTILVAAVAAAVLISTSNVLQQRSLLVGQEARKKITDGVDIYSIMAKSNYTTETFNYYEIVIRLSPGSDPLQLKNFNIEMLTNKLHAAAILYYPEEDNDLNLSGDLVADDTITLTGDLDGDNINDEIIHYTDGGNPDYVRFNLSREGLTDIISLGTDISLNPKLRTGEKPIRIGEEYFGSVEFDGTCVGGEIPSNIVNVRKIAEECNFELLPPEDYFCFNAMVGNDDTVLDDREKLKLLYKTKESNELTVGEDLMLIFASDKGRMTEARGKTPDVIMYTSTRIWPNN